MNNSREVARKIAFRSKKVAKMHPFHEINRFMVDDTINNTFYLCSANSSPPRLVQL